MKHLFLLAVASFAFCACNPYQDEDIAVPAISGSASFTAVPLLDDPNKIVVTDLSTNGIDRLWAFPDAIPAGSKKAVDTIFFPKAGDFTITLYSTEQGGAGVRSTSQPINIANDGVALCDSLVSLLTGECGTSGKCWTFSQVAKAISVGPVPGSSEWFSSTEGGLVEAQYDDLFCLSFEGQKFTYNNNGLTVDPFNGYEALPFTAGNDWTWFLSLGTGDGGKNQLILPDGAFIGTLDSGPTYDIVSVDENNLVLRSLIIGNPGWFEFTLIRE